jgi:hypothetical protein
MELMTLHTVWMYWPGDDAIELCGALDDHTVAENHDAWVKLMDEAAGRVGPENVRAIRVEVNWADICRPFETPVVEGTVASSTREPS